MYIEKLTIEDFKKFALKFDCGVEKVENLNTGEIYLKLFVGVMGPQPELWISDFDLRTSSYYKNAEKKLKIKYIKFMNEKFGEQYQKDYTQDYNRKIDEERII